MLHYCDKCSFLYYEFTRKKKILCPKCGKPMHMQNPHDAPWADIRFSLTSNLSIEKIWAFANTFDCPRVFYKEWLQSRHIPVLRFFGWDRLSEIMTSHLSVTLASLFLYLPLFIYLLAKIWDPQSVLSFIVGKEGSSVQASLIVYCMTAFSAALSMAFYYMYTPRHFKIYKTKHKFLLGCKGNCEGHELTSGQLTTFWELTRHHNPKRRILVASLIVTAFIFALFHFIWRFTSPLFSIE